jgi:hypothetical protein
MLEELRAALILVVEDVHEISVGIEKCCGFKLAIEFATE